MAASIAMRPRRGHLLQFARSPSFAGMTLGWLFLVMSLTPSLLPRSWLVQGLVSGAALAQGYGLGIAMAWTARKIGVPRPPAAVRLRAWYVLAVLALITIPLFLVLGARWEGQVRGAGEGPGPGFLDLGIFVIAAGLAAAIIGCARLISGLYRALAAQLHFLPAFAGRLTAAVLVAVMTAVVTIELTDHVLLGLADGTFSATNNGNLPGVHRPLSPLRSGSPSSLVPWDTLGLQGRAFVSRGPTPAQIKRFTGRHAVESIRVYAGLDSAPTLQGEANLALRELQRTGAFQRALIAVAVPTGRGSVYPTFADPLEYMYGGNTATAAIQYSYQPSWIAFLLERSRAQEAGRALFNTIYRYWSGLPAAHRPLLVVGGESLGAYGAEAAFSGVADMTARTSGALFIGPPKGGQMRRELTQARVKGTPEWLPVYGNGRTVRFAASARDLRQTGGGLRHPHSVYLQHTTDPVVWWSPDLIWHKPDWLAETRAPGVPSKMQWYPFVTFWQISADLLVQNTALGYGHHYGAEIPTAWAAILHPPGWTSADTARLTASRLP